MVDAKIAAALAVQRREITEYYVYSALAKICKDPGNAAVLQNIADEEKKHAQFWQNKTGTEAKPSRFKIFHTVLRARILGLTFTLKQMEKTEKKISLATGNLAEHFPGADTIMRDEADHEKKLINMLDEERLRYAGSVVLGLNDALVELTGSLAGFTLALGNTRLISLAGLVTGVSASFSMAASEFLSCRAENDPRAAKSALYTGIAYVITVAILILPFLLLPNKFAALGITLLAAVLIILVFNYYLATARDLDFKSRFLEMTAISIGVALLSFGIGFILNKVLGV
ncbi:MAG: VIT1/CCC1 family protein [Treponema sp.]|nr:VIT1/CCC1 family protein [Treponema sp.]